MAKRRRKADVKSKQSYSFGSKTKTGKVAKSGTRVTFKDGTSKVLLTPSGKGEKFANELSIGMRVTNEGEFKTDNNGNPMVLTAEQRAYRSGYLDARKDGAKVHNSKKKAGKK